MSERPDLHDLLHLATEVAREAGDLVAGTLLRARKPVAMKSSGTDVVTAIDLQSERLIVERLRSSRPHDGTGGEELGVQCGSSGVQWLIDPIDGTVNFSHGMPFFSVSIAANIDGVPSIGVVYDPMLKETFAAARGLGAWLNGESLAIEPSSMSLSQAVVATGFDYRADRRKAQADVLSRVVVQVADIRRIGSAALEMCWVGAGRLDAYYEVGVKAWDFAASALIASEAGATVMVDACGPDIRVVAARPHLMAGLRRVLG